MGVGWADNRNHTTAHQTGSTLTHNPTSKQDGRSDTPGLGQASNRDSEMVFREYFTVHTEHIPGVMNTRADEALRKWSENWSGETIYAFPPFALCLQKMN